MPPVLEGAAPLTAACPSLEGRAGDEWVRQPGHGNRHDPVPLAMLDPCPAPRLRLRFQSSDRQPMLILEVDLLCQMLAQRFNAVGTEIIVEIPEARL